MNAPAYGVSSAEQGRLTNALDIPILDGMFSADDSREPVLQLLFDLQNYHRRRNFSHQERFGEPDPWSEKMLVDLSEAIKNAKQMLEDARHSDITLALESSVRIAVFE